MTSGSRLIQKTLISTTMDEDNHSHRRRCHGGRTTSPRQRTRHHLHSGETVDERQLVRDKGRHGRVWQGQIAHRARSSEESNWTDSRERTTRSNGLRQRRWTVTPAARIRRLCRCYMPEDILVTLLSDGPASVFSQQLGKHFSRDMPCVNVFPSILNPANK